MNILPSDKADGRDSMDGASVLRKDKDEESVDLWSATGSGGPVKDWATTRLLMKSFSESCSKVGEEGVGEAAREDMMESRWGGTRQVMLCGRE